MTATLTAADPDFDRDDLLTLLDLSARIVQGARDDWRTLAAGFRPAATVDQRVNAVLLLAGPLADLIDTADEELLLRAYLPRLSPADRNRILADVRDALAQVVRWENAAAGYDVPDDDDHDPDERAATWRSDARNIALAAALR